MPNALSDQTDLLMLFLRRWRTILAFFVLGTGAAVTYALLASPWYSATLRVVPSQRSQDTAAMSIASRLPMGLDSVSTDVQRIKDVFGSVSVADEVITKFNLQDRYGTEHIEHTRKALAEHCATAIDKKSSVVALSCEDKDPRLAMEMAAFFGEVGNRVFARISVSSAREERRFLETQVVKARQDVDEASKKLREFQEKHRIIDLPEQTKAVMSAMASLEGEMLSKQLELSYLTRFSARTEPGVVQLQQQIAIMQAQLAELSQEPRQPAAAVQPSDDKKKNAAKDVSFFPGAMAVPALRFELEQLLREQKVRETVFALMTQRFEMARVDEARDTSTFQILDHPTLPTYKSRPKRTRIVAVGAIAAVCIALAWIWIPFWWRRRSLQITTATNEA